jgi:hypothetical protein
MNILPNTFQPVACPIPRDGEKSEKWRGLDSNLKKYEHLSEEELKEVSPKKHGFAGKNQQVNGGRS